MTNPASNRKNLEVEYLRGVAIALAVLTHLPIFLPFHTDFLVRIYNVYAMPGTGVDLFFCISGFVVSKAFLDYFDRHRAEGRFALGFQVFWIRRAFRLLPTAWLWVVVGTGCSICFNQTGVFGTPWENVRSAAVVVTACGNFANQYGQLLHPNDVYWSLALEEQFYLLFPFFLLAATSFWRWRVLLALIAIQFFVDRNVNLLGTTAGALAASMRLDSIMWGVLIFLLSRTQHYRQLEPTLLKRSRAIAAAVNGLLLYLLVAIPAQFPLLPTSMGMVAMVACALVFMASFEQGYATPFPFVTKPLVWLGARSYGVYIIHIVAFRLTYEAWSRYASWRGAPLDAADTLPMVLTAAAVMLGLSEWNYRFIELGFRDRGIRVAQARVGEYGGDSPGVQAA